MEFDLDPAGPLPLYRQLADRVRRLVALGALRPGDQLPTVRDLAVRARVNRNTAARAVQELERQGVVRTRIGSGTFIADGALSVENDAREAMIERKLEELVSEARALGLSADELQARLHRQLSHGDLAEAPVSEGDER